jgi:hypothetical protein
MIRTCFYAHYCPSSYPLKKTTSFYPLRIQFIHFKKALYNDDVNRRRLRKKNATPLWSYYAFMTDG